MIQTAAISFSLLFHSLGLFGATQTIQSYICQPPVSPTITTPKEGDTVFAGVSFSVTGTGTASSTISVSVDSTDVVDVTSDENGRYNGDVLLSEGTHTISVNSNNPCGSSTGPTISVSAQIPPSPPDTTSASTDTATDQTPAAAVTAPITTTTADQQQTSPTTSDQQQTSKGIRLSISTPANNTSTTDPSIQIKGTTNRNAIETIKVGGTIVATTHTPALDFGASVPLSLGANTITITATSGSTSATVVLTITRNAPAQAKAWYQTEAGKTVVRVAAVSGVSFIFVLFIIGLFLL